MTVDIFQPEGHFNDNKVLCAAPSTVLGNRNASSVPYYRQSNQAFGFFFSQTEKQSASCMSHSTEK